jgi:hypothetical protein
MTLGDRIVVMKDGFIRQVGTPQEVFDHPADLFVASFIGSPQMNFLDAELTESGGVYEVTAAGVMLPLPAVLSDALHRHAAKPGPVVLGGQTRGPAPIRRGDRSEGGCARTHGSTVNIHADIGGKDVVAVVPAGLDGRPAVQAAKVRLLPDSRKIHLFDSETAQASQPYGRVPPYPRSKRSARCNSGRQNKQARSVSTERACSLTKNCVYLLTEVFAPEDKPNKNGNQKPGKRICKIYGSAESI